MKHDRPPRILMDLWLAAVLLTRLPLPHLPDKAFAFTARAVWAYPVVGAALAAACGGLGTVALAMGVDETLSAGLVLAALAIATGAMHEDGLADVADGFWGGGTVARRLEIMRDSQIGSYGVLALLLVTGLRWFALASLLPQGIAAFVTAAALSRATMPVVMHLLPHARADGLARSVGRPALPGVLAGGLLAVGLGALLTGPAMLLALPAAMVVIWLVGGIARSKIRGQTGDVLGCTQILTETAILICLSAMLA